MRNLHAEIELKREQESLMAVRTQLYSMSDEEFRQYWVRVGHYFRAYSAYISHLTGDELHQFNLLGPATTPSRVFPKNGALPGASQTPSGASAKEGSDTSVDKSLGEPVEVP